MITLIPNSDFEIAPASEDPKKDFIIHLGWKKEPRPKREGYSHRKYRPGPVIKSFDFLADAAKRGTWVFHGDKVYPAVWICNWKMRTIEQRFRSGALRMAIRNKMRPLKFTALEAKPMPNFWWITCDEIPNFDIGDHGTLEGSMESVIEMCNFEAKKRGHFGEVQVSFTKDGL
jgi:hypothetical protein